MSSRGPRACESGPQRAAREDRSGTLARVATGGSAHAAAAGDAPLPADLREVLAVANGDVAATAIAKARTGLAEAVLHEAALRFIRDALHAPGATLYRRLGVAPDAPIARIREHYRELIAVFHPDRLGADAQPCDVAIATALNEAWNTLKHPESRARYDRLRATPAAAPAPIVPPRAAPPWHPDTASAPAARPPRWKRVREPGRLHTWLRSQSPRTLKALSFALLLAIAGLAVVLVAPDRAPSLAIRLPDAPDKAAAAPASVLPLLADAITPAPVRVAAPHTEPASRESVAAPRIAPGTETRAESSPAPVVATVAARAPEAPASAPVAAPPVAAAVVAVAPPATDRATRDPSVRPVTGVTPAVAPIAEPVSASPPTAAEVDTLVARFARAYEAGDFGALRDLVDPDAAQDNRMALTLASFARVFHESATRRIELAVQERAADADRARIELVARTTLAGPDGEARAGGGTLSFVVRRRGGTPVLVDIRYRERAPA